jgi:hypothetical protein
MSDALDKRLNLILPTITAETFLKASGLLRSHTLLNNLHSIMGQTPLVMFYPGRYDGVSLRLFGKTTLSVGSNSSDAKRQDPYYRAFRLIPEENNYAH